MKNKLLALLLGVVTLPAFAGVDGYLGYSSDYIWRGVSQTSGNAAMSGKLEVSNGGLYGGVWASEVDFGDEATYEMDLFLGYELMVSDKFSLDVGVIQYNWDKGYDDVEELFAKVNLKNLSVAYYVDMEDSDRDYMEMGLKLPFVKFMDVSVNYGMFDSENDFWALSMVKDWGNWEVSFYMTEDAKQDQFMDNASLGLFYKF
tara:strand:+ start:343 stop:948 length:606 start_codon:yes stop_codon:yes gene_type:complete